MTPNFCYKHPEFFANTSRIVPILYPTISKNAPSIKEEMPKGNVLSKIVVPRINLTSKYIVSELDEKEREETFRLKRVKQKKMADRRKEELKILEERGLDKIEEDKEEEN
ncbi:unnamed protein product [Pieris brassicae]|uniref:Uncharacterized protein n=1 Tax=Pieris brassicae TaxID=7116 RepID=A0A9P0XKZ0_PIEBR|nr:unnamed protein product [Pieris brassicae]